MQYVFGYANVKLSDLFDIKNGYTPSKSVKDYWDNGSIPWFRLEDINEHGRVLTDAKQHITSLAIKSSGLFAENSLIFSTSATIGEYALIKKTFLCNQRFTCMSVKPYLKDLVNIRYLLDYCYKLSDYAKANLNQGNFASVDMKRFGEFKFVLPVIKEQNRIIDLLDKFDSYCNNLSKGLPTEINERNKQYEYYRDKLLSFKRLGEE